MVNTMLLKYIVLGPTHLRLLLARASLGGRERRRSGLLASSWFRRLSLRRTVSQLFLL